MCSRNEIGLLQKIKSRSKTRSHKYGIQLPCSVQEAKELDKAKNNTYWTDAIWLEMSKNRVAFDILDQGTIEELGRTYLDCYMIY